MADGLVPEIVVELRRTVELLGGEADASLPLAIRGDEIVARIRDLGADANLLRVLRGWQNAAADEWVLENLREWNNRHGGGRIKEP